MIDLAARRPRGIWLIPAGLVAAVLLALAVVRFGPAVLAVLGGVVALSLVYLHPELGLFALVLSLPIEDLLPGIGPATGTRLLGMGVFGIWALRKTLRRESWRPLFKSPLMMGALLLLGWSFASFLWAGDRTAAAQGMLTQLQLFFLALLAIDLAVSWERSVWVVRLLVLGGLIAAGFSLEQYYVQGIRRAGDGVSGGINYTASFLVTLLPFAFYLIRARTGGFWTFLGALYVPLGVVAVTVSFSRSSYILLVIVLVVHTWLLLRTRARRGWVFLLGGLIVAAFITAPKEAVNERVQTISPLLASWFSPTESEAQAADARAFHWQVGFEMFKDSPVLGVGSSNFGIQFLSYQFEVPGPPDFFLNPRSAHSSYVGLLTELGPLGLGLFVFILGAALLNLVRARGWLRQGGAAETRLYLVEAFFYALVFQVLYGWALNTHMNKNFWLILAMSVALAALSRRERQALDSTQA
ncbi:MAG TPA: O-antigen ligase family protein [Anaerolineaceae bacterium]|nr:O-antigen ligase family protein [Anaerolineaceae bacterium]